MGKAISDGEKESLPFNRKKPPGRDGHLPQWLGDEVKLLSNLSCSFNYISYVLIFDRIRTQHSPFSFQMRTGL